LRIPECRSPQRCNPVLRQNRRRNKRPDLDTLTDRYFRSCEQLISLVIALIVRALLVRDAIMSRLLSTTPDRVGLKSGLIVRAVAYVVLPLIALFAVGFPEAGGSLLG
jgi:hypothetical protein